MQVPMLLFLALNAKHYGITLNILAENNDPRVQVMHTTLKQTTTLISVHISPFDYFMSSHHLVYK